VFSSGCDETLRDPHWILGGIPLACWGVLYFTAILVLLALGRLLGDAVRGTAASSAALLVTAGGLSSVALLAAMFLEEAHLCPLCIVVHGLSLAAVVPVFRWSGWPMREVLRDWKRAVRHLAGGKAEQPAAVPMRYMTLLCVGLVGVVLHQGVLIEWDRAILRGKTVNPERVLNEYADQPVLDIPITDVDPTLGPATAKATLVVFSDAFCPACRGFWNILPRIAGPYGDDLRVVFKHFPLDPPCNPGTRDAIHPFACQAGIAQEAALRQDKFWQYQAVVQAPDPMRDGEKDVFLEAAKAVELDVVRFVADMKDEALKKRLEDDVALGDRLGVDATPALFLNGRRVTNSSPKTLEVLLEDLLGKRVTR
jgi:protein-disulfide isomerase/uncharacterized membrane protein